jgi:hypothetical protein
VELQRRVDTAQNIADRLDPQTHAWFRETYGLDFTSTDRGALTAYVLDPERGMDVVNRVLKGGRVAGAAAGRGVRLTQAQAEQFGTAAELSTLDRQAAQFADMAYRGAFLSQLYGGDYDTQRAGEDVFLGDTAAEQERIRLQKREGATFAGGGGAANERALGQGPGGY